MKKVKSTVEYEVPTILSIDPVIMHTIRGSTSKEWQVVKEAMLERLEDKVTRGIGVCTVIRTIQGGMVYERVPSSFNKYSHYYRDILQTHMMQFIKDKGWYSGCSVYPIADPKFSYYSSNLIGIEGMTAGLARKVAAKKAYHHQGKWDRRTTYGKRRHATMNYILAYIDAIINELQKRETL